VYTLGSPDVFALANQKEENKDVIIIERKDGNIGKYSAKGMNSISSILFLINLHESALLDFKGMLKRSYISAVDVYGILGIMRLPSGMCAWESNGITA
jgi:hypothetical protein